MNLKEKIEKFNHRWNVQTETEFNEEIQKFKRRMLNIFDNIDQHVSAESIRYFCNYYGIAEKWTSNRAVYTRYRDRNLKKSSNIYDRLSAETDKIEIYKLIEIIFSLDIITTMGFDRRAEYSKEILFNRVKEAISFSNINLSIGRDGEGGIILYPTGEKMLDEEVVNSTLKFLDNASNVHFVDALKSYQNKKWIKSAESLRRALEEFLKYKLKNKKGLTGNRLLIGKILKENKADSQIINVILCTIGYLDQYFNENSKHNDGYVDETENEFLIYQVGIIARYIDKSIK